MNLSHSTGIVIFCDGACSGNPGPGGWGAIVVSPDGQVCELGGSSPRTTNNQMELTAAIEALDSVGKVSGPATVCTDSTYVIRGITEWIWGWRRRNWLSSEGSPVANRELWEKLSARVTARGKDGKVSWRYVKGHALIPGNERADAIAVAFSKSTPTVLYRGPLSGYSVAVLELPDEGTEPPKTKANRPTTSKSAARYLSLVDGKPMRHATWKDCEARVRGKSGAKFKKAGSVDEEKGIWRSWGVDPSVID